MQFFAHLKKGFSFCRSKKVLIVLSLLVVANQPALLNAGEFGYEHYVYDAQGNLISVHGDDGELILENRWGAWGNIEKSYAHRKGTTAKKAVDLNSQSVSYFQRALEGFPVRQGFASQKTLYLSGLIVTRSGSLYAPHLKRFLNPDGGSSFALTNPLR